MKRVSMKLNGRTLDAFDPFHSNHPATIPGPEERIRVKGHDVVIRAFTLPHHKKVTPAEWSRYEGRGGYLKNQGFYVYRAKRLIIHGTWFGLARQAELTKLARVRIDMPNQLDTIGKSTSKRHRRNRHFASGSASGLSSKPSERHPNGFTRRGDGNSPATAASRYGGAFRTRTKSHTASIPIIPSLQISQLACRRI